MQQRPSFVAMLNERPSDGPVSAERFFEIAAIGRGVDIDALLARFPASARIRDPIAIGLRGMKAIVGGDVLGGTALLKRAAGHCNDHLRPYLLDLLIPLLISMGQMGDAELAMAAVEDVEGDLAPAFLALRAVLAARAGNDALSAAYAREALDLGRTLDNALIVGRILLRAGLAAFYREDFEEAQERALEAARWYEKAEAHRSAAQAYSILYVIAHDWLNDPDVTRYYARRMTMSAVLAGDSAIETVGLMSQLETAAEAGDERRYGSLRGRLLANPTNEQYYRTRYNYQIADALVRGWSGGFELVRTSLTLMRRGESLTMPERALCDALLAIIALANWQLDEARSLARRVINQTTVSVKEPLFEARRRKIARILAAAVCIIAGDTTRGRRALNRAVDPDGRFAMIITTSGMDEERTPALMRGYARFINQACLAASQTRPQLGLTEAELTVLKALPEGATLATIASSLGKSKKTVEKQVGSIYTKLEVSSRAEAVRRARDLGIHA